MEILSKYTDRSTDGIDGIDTYIDGHIVRQVVHDASAARIH